MWWHYSIVVVAWLSIASCVIIAIVNHANVIVTSNGNYFYLIDHNRPMIIIIVGIINLLYVICDGYCYYYCRYYNVVIMIVVIANVVAVVISLSACILFYLFVCVYIF